MIKAVSFDCAQTLVYVRWNPVEVALQAAKLAEVDFSQPATTGGADWSSDPYGHYAAIFGHRQDDWKRSCSRHEPGFTSQEFWRRLTFDWLRAYGQEGRTEDVIAAAEQVLFAAESRVFIPIPGAREAVMELKQMGMKVIVLSNWDDSLVKVLTHCGLADLFDEIYASLVEGCEKPESEFFSIAQDSLGLRRDEVLHVGDNPLDDAVGALSFGWQALLFRNELSAGPWDLTDEDRERITKLRPDFSLAPWLPCPVIHSLSEAVDRVKVQSL